MLAGESFAIALEKRCFEPDAPNFTPRISAIIDLDEGFTYKISILKCGDGKGGVCDRYCFRYEPQDGVGHFIHTYKGDGNPLPSFEGEPTRVAVPADIDEFASTLWNSLDADNKISLYVGYIDIESRKVTTRLFNKHVG